MTSYNDISTITQRLEYLQQQIRQLQTQPRLISSSIDRGGTQSSDYNGAGINTPGSAGWFIGTDETTGVGYVHINGRRHGSIFVKVANDAEQQTAVDTLHPSPDLPLVVVRTDGPPNTYRFTTDGIVWSQTSPVSVPYVEPTLINSWVNYRSGFHKAGYIKSSSGIVCLSGLVAGGASGSVIFSLPVECRPDHDLLIPAIGGNALATVRVYASTGEVTVLGASATSFTSLSGIMFPAAGVATWTPVTTFASGWASYHTVDPAFGVLSYWQDPLGRVWFDGMARQTTPSTLGVLTTMFTLPVRKRLGSHYPALGNNSFATVLIDDDSTQVRVRAHVGTITNWVALTKSQFVVDTVRPIWERNDSLYLNSWAKYPDAQFPDRVFMAFQDGMCFQDGLIGGGPGIGAGNTCISTFGVAGYLPDIQTAQNNSRSGMEIFTVASNLAVARSNIVGVGPAGQWTGDKAWEENTGSTTWRSYGGVNYMIGA